MISSVVGLQNSKVPKAETVISVHEEEVELYGTGLYANDSVFKATIFQGTDATILFLIGPLSLALLFFVLKSKRNDLAFLLTSVMSFYFYQGLSMSLGAMMNRLFLLYILTVGVNLVALIACFRDLQTLVLKLDYSSISRKGIMWLLGINGLALIAAWMPDLIAWTINGQVFRSLEMYTTGVTKVLDIGIIVALIIYAMVLVYKKDLLGILIFDGVIGVGMIIGFVVIGQSIYQLSHGVELSLAEILIKGFIFSLLSMADIIVLFRTVKSLK